MNIKIKINNWEKYQYRKKDVKRHSWFRFENQFFINHKTVDMTGDEIKLYLFCLCEASREICEEFVISPDLTCRLLNFSEKLFNKLLISIESLGLVSHVRVPRTGHRRATDVPLHNITEHNITEHNISSAPDGAPPWRQLLGIWNENRGTLPEARALSKKREASAKSRWTEHPSQEYWVSVVQRVATSRFCNGDNDRGWKADFEWFLKPDVHLKVLEGKYDGKGSMMGNFVIVRNEANRIGVKK